MSWWQQLIGPAIGAVGGYLGGRENERANEAMSGPTHNTSWLEPWANVGTQLDESIRQYSDQVFNFTPSYYGAPPPRGGGGGGANTMRNGMNNLFGQGGFGGGLQDFISGNLGQGNQFMQDAYNQYSGFSPYRLDEMQGHLAGLAETPYMHQYLQSGGGLDSRGALGDASAFMMASGVHPGMIYGQQPNLGAIMGQVGSFGGGGGGGGGFDAGQLGEPTNDWMRNVLDGSFLNAGNPYAQQVTDAMAAQIGKQYRELDVPQIDAAASRAGRYGSNAAATTQAQARDSAQRNISDSTTAYLGQNWEAERQRMIEALGMLNQLDQQKLQSAASAYAADAGAGASRFGSQMGLMGDIYGTQMNSWNQAFGDSMGLYGDIAGGLLGHDLQSSELMQNAILGYGDQRLRGGQMNLDAAMGATQADLAALEGLAGLAGTTGQYDLGLLGAGNDLVNSQMQGFASLGALQNQGAAQRHASDMDRWRYEQDRFNYMRDAPRQNILESLGVFGGLAETFGTQQQHQTGPPRQFYGGGAGSGAVQGFLGGVLNNYANNQRSNPYAGLQSPMPGQQNVNPYYQNPNLFPGYLPPYGGG